MKLLQAIVAALALIILQPAHAGPADAKINAAAELFQNGDYQGAAAKFKQALALEPNNALAWHFYGQCLAQMGDLESARKAYEKVLKLSPSGKLADRTRELIAKLIGPIEMVAIPGKNYEIGKYEVTQGQWKEIMGDNPSYFQQCGDNCPVEQVSWNDVQNYLKKLNALTGKQYRLPTKAEWEQACYGYEGLRGGVCGRHNDDAAAWYGDNSNRSTHTVGQKQPNGYGLYDMSGNVSELTGDKNTYDRTWHCGGSWLSQVIGCDDDLLSTDNNSGTGFRLARTLR